MARVQMCLSGSTTDASTAKAAAVASTDHVPLHMHQRIPSSTTCARRLNPRMCLNSPCAGDLSRNRTVGLKLGRGMKLSDIIESMHGAVAEGVLTSRAAHDLAKKLGVEVPIIDGIHKVIHGAYYTLTISEQLLLH